MINVLIFLGLWIGCGIITYALSRFFVYLAYKTNCLFFANGFGCEPEKICWKKTRLRFVAYLGISIFFGPIGLNFSVPFVVGYAVCFFIAKIYYFCKNKITNEDSWWNKKTKL